MFVTRGSKNSFFSVFGFLYNLDWGQWYKFRSAKAFQWVTRRHKVLTHEQECLFRKVTSVSIHSFVEWLDTFSYVLRPAEVTVKEVNHNRCFAIDIAKYLILLSCRLAMEHLWRQHFQRLSPHGLHWPAVDEGLDTAALTSVSLMILGRRNATTDGSGNNLVSFSLFFQFLSNDIYMGVYWLCIDMSLANHEPRILLNRGSSYINRI